MIGFGIALAVVCALSLFDRRALPYALLLSAGWLLGFGPAEAWPFVSILSGLGFVWLLRKGGPPWAWIAACCVPPMLLCDAIYFWMLSQGVYLGPEYATTLNTLFAVQLLAIGWPGALRGGRSFVSWLCRPRGRSVDCLPAQRVSGQGSRDGR